MPQLSDDRLGVTLLRVSPGAEMTDIQEWLRRIENHPRAGFQAEVYLTLGRSDVAIFHAPNLEEAAELCPLSLPNVACATVLDCYAWKGQATITEVLQKPLCAMVFMRLNPDLCNEPEGLQVQLEQTLADHIANYTVDGQAAVTLLGAYGRASNIALFGADDIGQLLRATYSLIRTCPLPEGDLSSRLLRETYTILGVEWPQPDIGFHALRERYPLLHADGDHTKDAQIAIEMRCSVPDIPVVSSLVKIQWPDKAGKPAASARVSVAFGPADLYVDFPLSRYETFGGLIVDIHEFRDLCNPVLLTTETRIHVAAPVADAKTVNKWAPQFVGVKDREVPEVLLSTALAGRILHIHDEAPAIIHSLHAYNHRLWDDGGEAVRDLHLHYSECVELASHIADNFEQRKPIVEQLRDLYKKLEMGQIGQLQRLDSFPMSRRAGTDLGPYRSGIRRRLWAAQAIPSYILTELLPGEWRGFLVGGRLQDAFMTWAPVMNIPAESLPHPETWWVLTHESMHDFVERWPLLDFHEDPWPAVFRDYAGPRLPLEVKEREYLESEVGVECVCDMLEFLSLGDVPWQTHQRVCWSYVLERLARERGQNREDRSAFVALHVLRSLCAMRCTDELRHSGVEDLIDLLSGDVVGHLQVQGVPTASFYTILQDLMLKRRLVSRGEALGPVVDWLVKNVPFVNGDRPGRDEWCSSSYKGCCEILREGKLVAPNVLRYPDLLVWLLKSEWIKERMPSQMATAVTLSLLWHYIERMDI